MSPSSSLMVVVLPAPFGPRKPTIEFFLILRFKELTALTPSNVLLKSLVCTITALSLYMLRCLPGLLGRGLPVRF
jgi:hypothetical protein